MSLVRTVELECPKCHAHVDFHVWDSVNVDLDPEMHDKVLNFDIFRHTCPRCGDSDVSFYSTLYHDMKRNFMVYLSGEDTIPEGIKEAYENISKDFGNRDSEQQSLVLRCCNSPFDFREKILLFENGLDDVAVERLKYYLRNYLYPKMSCLQGMLVFEGIKKITDDMTDFGYLMFIYRDEKGTHALPARLEDYYNFKLATSLDDRFKVASPAIVDKKWMTNVMKGVKA